ncbi:hypothetical protein [Klebsiella pneumoniae IS43]|uniref:Uncharacterized protein n=1 Tax=Klebsiella pneumoniae IS43 TaxID=1432552 RepID=W1DRT4_KLEPN|nr:hypothetical protein [Klebsiella pneumoniae IS43]
MRLRNKSCRLLGIGAITLRHIGCRRRCLLRDKNMVQDARAVGPATTPSPPPFSRISAIATFGC